MSPFLLMTCAASIRTFIERNFMFHTRIVGKDNGRQILERTAERKAWPRGYKTFFKLSSAEHEISTAHKCLNSQNWWKIQVQNSKTSNLSCS